MGSHWREGLVGLKQNLGIPRLFHQTPYRLSALKQRDPLSIYVSLYLYMSPPITKPRPETPPLATLESIYPNTKIEVAQATLGLL